MELEQDQLKKIIENILEKKIVDFSLKGKGMCNNAWYAKTSDNEKYLIKQERPDKEAEEQNDLVTEAKTIQKLHEKNPNLPIPQIVFISELHKMYCYKYVEGEMMRGIWGKLSENEKILLCKDLGKFHAEFEISLSKDEAKNLGLNIDISTGLHKEIKEELDVFLNDSQILEKYKEVVKQICKIFDETDSEALFGFCHNDSHHENIIIREGRLACVIDFGDTEYGSIYAEFTRYVKDYPDYFEIIVKTYEELSNKKLSRTRLIAQTILDAIDDIRTDYDQEGREKIMRQYVSWFAKFTPSPSFAHQLEKILFS
ncbi:phosphotransferase [Empedobacter falsenii]|uniref:phosphotransferase n=1 Tax=Empedobacter falsenii TaxID=343874 RepID=UPI002577B390|nr:phosphotransferase [Empedobacter falsenii]MDM1549544.1 phosphotransferase [Empedobacter falsenii]